jgi:N-acetyl-1-D-myo-inositol-2-amino-2-deoxy-alpha-D-glucopyranoside deacetylase
MAQPRRHILFVHAHPDDETITTGAAIARCVSLGAAVTVVTLTLGEEGDVLVPELGQLSSAHADQLGGHRLHELADAMAILGVSDHRYLGGAGRFRDSGMAGSPANGHPRALARTLSESGVFDRAVFDDAVDLLGEIIGEIGPDSVVTYDPNGGYGHPDHIATHRITTEAVARGGAPEGRLYWIAAPRTALERELAEAARVAPPQFLRVAADELPWTPDRDVTTVLDGAEYAATKLAALAAHASQITVRGATYALSNEIARFVDGVEYFQRVLGLPATPVSADGLEHGLLPE